MYIYHFVDGSAADLEYVKLGVLKEKSFRSYYLPVYQTTRLQPI